MSDYPNSGILFTNQYKRSGSKAPDVNGNCRFTCPHCQAESEHEIAGWIREGRKQFTALKFTEKTEAERKKMEAKAKKSGLPVEITTPPPAQHTGSQAGDDDVAY